MGMRKSESGKLGYIKTRDKIMNYNKHRRDYYLFNPKKCKQCGKTLEWKQRRYTFCSHVCAAVSRGGIHRKDSTYCVTCGIQINKKRQYKNTYCSKKCQQIHTFRTKRDVGNELDGASIRKYLLNTREHLCTECGITEWNNKTISLEVHHVDGYANNNSEENLTLLCPNCHSQTPNYKHKNRGSGREWRCVNHTTTKELLV